MARYPSTKGSLKNIGENRFSISAKEENDISYFFQVGDVWRSILDKEFIAGFSNQPLSQICRYLPPGGKDSLCNLIANYLSQKMGNHIRADNVMVGSGGTACVACAIGAIAEPGDEILIFSPHWPLIPGILHSFNAIPVYIDLLKNEQSKEVIIETLENNISPKTVAMYVNFPNNPTGKVLPKEWMLAILQWADMSNLWIITDEAYEEFIYTGEPYHISSYYPERTISSYTFSKSYGIPGLRCGFLVGPEDIVKEINKINTHTFYGISSFSQALMEYILTNDNSDWLKQTKNTYQNTGIWVARQLNLPQPEGGIYHFWDISHILEKSGMEGFLKRCQDRGLYVSPGTIFGNYPNHIRICYTVEQPEIVKKGILLLSELIQEYHS